MKRSSIICNCTGNEDEIFIDSYLLHSRNPFLHRNTSFVRRANSRLTCMLSTEAGRVSSCHVLFIEFITVYITVYFCPKIYHREIDFLLSF